MAQRGRGNIAHVREVEELEYSCNVFFFARDRAMPEAEKIAGQMREKTPYRRPLTGPVRNDEVFSDR